MDLMANPLQVAEERTLQPFLPMIYVAWAGGELAPSQLRNLRERLESISELDDDARLLLNLWLDPDAPPSAAQLKILLKTIRPKVAALPADSRTSLAEIGLALAQGEGSVPASVRQALEEIQVSLGVPGREGVREIVPDDNAPTPEVPSEVGFSVEAMTDYLESPYGEQKAWMRQILAHPRFFHRYGESKETMRERVVNWAGELAREGLSSMPYPKKYGGQEDIGGFLAATDTLAGFDGSLLIKFGVHAGLFGGSIFNLGTEEHHRKYLPQVFSLKLPGCFAMTETGHGSNVRDIETTATYDQEHQQFVVHTPTPRARKDYIGNAALHAQMATVFAQLMIDDEGYGVHAFLVPIRNARGAILPGITIEDDGHKIGLQGVDNGRITFNQVRIPRTNLLDKFGQVSPEGEYTSPINNPGRRFFQMLSTLVMGRVSISSAANEMSKVGLAIAVRYSEARRQFGPTGAAETPILDYQTFQRRLFPHLATAYALTFASKELVQMLLREDEEERRELEARAAGMKVYASWHAIESLQVCRESCGGQGYLSVNRFGTLKADVDVFSTFEGANPVLLQLVAKGLLTEYRHQFSGNKFFGVVKLLTKQAATVLTEQNPLTTRNVDPSHLRDPEFHLAALRYREDSLLVSAAKRLKSRVDKKMDSFVAFNQCQDHLVTLARAHVERSILESFQRGVEAAPDPQVKEVLGKLCALFALTRIQDDSGWFLESGYLEGVKSKAIRKQTLRLCKELRPHVRSLVDAFNLPPKMLSAPIAQGEFPN